MPAETPVTTPSFTYRALTAAHERSAIFLYDSGSTLSRTNFNSPRKCSWRTRNIRPRLSEASVELLAALAQVPASHRITIASWRII